MGRTNRGYYLSDKPNARGHYEIKWAIPARTSGGRGNTGRHSTGKESREAAQLYYARWMIEREADLVASTAPQVPTVAEVIDVYLTGHVADNELDSKHAWQACALHVKHSKLGELLATHVTPEKVKDYGKARAAGRVGWTEADGKKRGYRVAGPAAFRNDILCLNSALRWAVRNRKFAAFTLAELHPAPVPPAPPPRTHYWTVTQADQLLSAAKARDPNGFDPLYLFILICLDTASRREAVEQLTWDRVKLWRDDAGNWQGALDFRVPGRRETKKRRGVNDLSTETATILADARAASRSPFVLGADAKVEFQFRRHALKALGDEQGPHILRHSWATWAISGGVPPADVAEVLHDTVATVMRVYAHVLPENRRRAVNLVAGLRAAANDAGTSAGDSGNGARTAGVMGA